MNAHPSTLPPRLSSRPPTAGETPTRGSYRPHHFPSHRAHATRNASDHSRIRYAKTKESSLSLKPPRLPTLREETPSTEEISAIVQVARVHTLDRAIRPAIARHEIKPRTREQTQTEKSWTFVIVPGPGKASHRVQLPEWCMALAVLIGLCGFAVSASVGWNLRTLDHPVASARIRRILPRSQHLASWLSRARAIPERTFEAPKRLLENWKNDFRYLARAKELGLGTHRAATKLLGGKVDSAWAKAAGNEQTTPGVLLWPVKSGRYVRGYGSGDGGYHLAVDIAAARGEDVLAAARGIVAYAGDSIRGYGNVILIVHPGGWITMYAHNSSHLVKAGQTVEQGAVIAKVGNTGISRGPHVHFEFMHRGRNCDPLPLFRPGVHHGEGRFNAFGQVTWSEANERPDNIRCDRRRRHPHSRWNSEQGEMGELPEDIHSQISSADLSQDP